MKTTLSTRLHTATWIVALILTAVPAIKGSPVEQLTGNIIATLFWMAVYYLFFLWLAPAGMQKGKIFQYFGISFLVIAILPFIGYSLLFLSRALFNGSLADFYNGYSIAMHLSGLKAMALAGVYGSFFSLITEHFGN
jgi:hypothetical protein